eukprot:15484390-Alexandrium_andersonii.AAC.1
MALVAVPFEVKAGGSLARCANVVTTTSTEHLEGSSRTILGWQLRPSNEGPLETVPRARLQWAGRREAL